MPDHWIVVWWTDGVEREALFRDHALAHAYAAAHRGFVVPMAALAPWPKKPALG